MTYAIDESGADEIAVSMRHPYAFELLPPSFVEYLWTIIVTRFRDHLDDHFQPTLYFLHPPGGALSTYRRVLGRVVFEAERTELRIPRAQWELANRHANDGLSSVLERHARELLARLPEPLGPLDRVRSAVVEVLRAGDAGIERAAARLGLSVRSLQRQLADDGYTYQQVLDEVRANLARVYLASAALSLSEVSYLLGYSDPSAFNRAFRRWTGTTPLAYRRGRGEPAGGARKTIENGLRDARGGEG